MTSFFLRSMYMYDKTIIIRFGFCDIQDNQGLGKGKADNPYLDLDYSGYHKNLTQYSKNLRVRTYFFRVWQNRLLYFGVLTGILG